MEKHQKFSIWYVLLGIWIVLIVQQYLGSFFSIEVIPYSQFLKLLKENKITEVAISVNQLQGKMKVEGEGVGKEKMFRSIRVDSETSKLLEQYNVNFKGEIESDFLPRLFSWIVPTAIFFGVWFFFMRRMMGQQQGFMTLGKNKAKIYMESELDVSFEDVAGVDEAKQELVEVVEFLKEPEKFTELGGKVGQVYFARKKTAQFLDMVGQGAAEYSEATAEMIDDEVRDIINTQYTRALDILRGKKQFLEKAARILLEKEKIDGEELKTLMAEN